MKVLSLIMIVFVFSVAKATEVSCVIKENTVIVDKNVLEVNEYESVSFGHIEDFSFKMKKTSPSRYNLDIFDGTSESRYSVEGDLVTKENILSWGIWRRDKMLDLDCSLF